MYNLLVTANGEAWGKPDYILSDERYLEYTDPVLKERLKPLNDGVVAQLMVLPTIFAFETAVAAPARVGWLRSIKTRGHEIRITFAFDPAIAPITPETLEAMSWDLDIGGEMSRTHWAVKERDLLQVLRSNGLLTPGGAAKPKYEFTRQTILKACTVLQTLGHTGFDHFVLELGLAGLQAGRDRGGLLARANALAEYVLGHADEVTAEDEPLALAVVRRAAQSDSNYPEPGRGNLKESERSGFWTGLKRDGYAFADGSIVAVLDEQTSLTPPDVTPHRSPAKSVSSPDTESPSWKLTMPVVSPSKIFIVPRQRLKA
jgi:hypothetical protein